MPVTLDPDAAAVFKAFQEAGRPPYESVSPAEARELYLKGRLVTNPEPPELSLVQALAIPDVWASHVQSFGKRRCTAQNGQFGQGCFPRPR